MANDTAKTVTTNIVPVQGIFKPEPTFDLVTFIGPAGTPFYANINPNQSGLHITNSTIDSTTIGATTPSSGVFTSIYGTTGQIATSPVANIDIANKLYVDTIAQGLAPKQACKVATTGNITLSGLQTLDTTYTIVSGDRVLVKNQSNSAENGIYIASSGAWTRSVDMDVWSEVPGAYTVILNGATEGSTSWVTTAPDTGTIGVTSMPWVQFSGVSSYFAGTGLNLIANTFSIANTGVTANTYGSASSVPVLAVNAQGQITSVTNTSISLNANQITSGILDVVRGGTGQSSYTDGQLLIGNSVGNTLTKATLTANTGISITNGNGSIGITNTAPDQIVSLTGAGTTVVTGTYPNFTITSNDAYVGTVTSVGTGTGLTGGPITSTGTINFSNASVGTWAATPSSANLANAMTDETGSGLLVFNDAPSLSRPTIDGANPYIQFNNGSAVAVAAGRLWYDGATGSWNAGMGGGNITQQIGEELFLYGKASSAITDSPLQIVYQSGTVGASGVITFAPTITGITNGDKIVGVATEPISLNAFGRVTTFGVIHGITTNGTAYGEVWADGDTIWYNPVTGNPTNVKPVAPNIKVSVGTVINAGSGGSGSFQVEINHGSVLGGTDSNVQLTSIANANLLQYDSTAQYWKNVTPSSVTGIGSASNLVGGGAGQIPYQSGANTTSFLGAGTTGQFLQSNGTGAPTWATPVSYATVTDDTTTNATRYPLFANQTAGSLSTEYTSSTKFQFNPSTGLLTALGFSGSGASLTSLNASNISSGTIGSAYVSGSYTGITGVGTLSVGVWNGTTIGIGYGGTGLSSTPTNGQLLIGNGTGYALSTLTAGAGISITNGVGSVTIASTVTGVTIADDTTSATAYYPLFATVTSGTATTEYTSSTKYTYKPSTGELTSPVHISSNGINVNSATVSASYSIPSGSNGMSAGPVSVASGITVTVPTGSTWVIV